MDPCTLISIHMSEYILHCFMPGQTIDAVIRLKGRHNLTSEEMIPLRQKFNELNGFQVIRPGMTCKIPLPKPIEELPSEASL